jgi:hypothetical protein
LNRNSRHATEKVLPQWLGFGFIGRQILRRWYFGHCVYFVRGLHDELSTTSKRQEVCKFINRRKIHYSVDDAYSRSRVHELARRLETYVGEENRLISKGGVEHPLPQLRRVMVSVRLESVLKQQTFWTS